MNNKIYCDNPVVAKVVDGELKNLDYKLLHDANIKEVKLFSPLGKRVYRHSICLLLSYAAACLFPERHLEIGHSLGDGFYFNFTNHEVTEDDVEKLIAKMEKTVCDDIKIETKYISYLEAVKLFSKPQYELSLSLLKTRNDSTVKITAIDGFFFIAYEPVVTHTSILSLWQLRKYKNGMLLRYPQTRELYNIKEFVDNPLLYQVFSISKENLKILHTSSLGELNQEIAKGNIERIITLSEAMMNRQISLISEEIKRRKSVKAIFIAGPSSSGKTTSSLKLFRELEIIGYEPIKISLDDYYLPKDQIPRDENGELDFEVMEALNLPLIRDNILSLLNKKGVHLPYYDFKSNSRGVREEETVLKENSILIIEGIHALNPNLIPGIDRSLTYKIYISCLTSICIDEHNRISTTDNRIIRRVVRDSRTRGIDPSVTLAMWPSVERGEKNHIFPYQNNADSMINSNLSYEIAALTPYAIPLLRSIKPNKGSAYTTARRILKFLELCYPIQAEKIPSDSVIREFIGGSIYGAI